MLAATVRSNHDIGQVTRALTLFHSLIPQRVFGQLNLIRFYSINSIILSWISTPGLSRPIPRVIRDTVRAALQRFSLRYSLCFSYLDYIPLFDFPYKYAFQALTTSPSDFILSTRHGI